MPMFVLIAAAVVCVVVSSALHNLVLGYVALGLSVAAALVFAIRSTFVGPRVKPGPSGDDGSSVRAAGAIGRDEPPAALDEQSPLPALEAEPIVPAGWEALAKPRLVEVTTPSTAVPVASTITVAVVPGRHRFHRPDCRLVGGHEVALMTAAQATQGGWSACTVCTPDA